MGLYDAQKHPFHKLLTTWSNSKVNEHFQRAPKSIPCHVTKVDKDFVEVQFETHDNTLTPPTVKLPQSFSPYGRHPTQVGDKGYAVPSDYHLGGVSGWPGGGTNYYPRGNLSPLSFQPVSHVDNPKRDYDKHTIVGGPNGIHLVQSNPPKQDQSQQQQQQTGTQQAQISIATRMRSNMRRVRTSRMVPGVGFYVMVPTPQAGGSTGAGGAPGGAPGQPGGNTLPAVPDPQADINQPDKASLIIDQNAKHTLDGTNKHRLTIDHQNNRMTAEVPADGAHYVWLGGPGTQPSKYAPVMTSRGPSVNVMAKISFGDG
jgi:hypothetical protein